MELASAPPFVSQYSSWTDASIFTSESSTHCSDAESEAISDWAYGFEDRWSGKKTGISEQA